MITFALPKGRIFKEVSELLRKTDFPEFDYKIFQEIWSLKRITLKLDC